MTPKHVEANYNKQKKNCAKSWC